MGSAKSKESDTDWNIKPSHSYNSDNDTKKFGPNKNGAEYFTDLNTRKNISAFLISYILLILLFYKYLFLIKIK